MNCTPAKVSFFIVAMLFLLGFGVIFLNKPLAKRAASTVEYVFPDGFRGPAKVEMNIAVADALPQEGNKKIVKFPSSGLIQIEGEDPLMSWHVRVARFEGGESLPIPTNLSNVPESPKKVLLHHMGYYRNNSDSWYYVGLAEDANHFFICFGNDNSIINVQSLFHRIFKTTSIRR